MSPSVFPNSTSYTQHDKSILNIQNSPPMAKRSCWRSATQRNLEKTIMLPKSRRKSLLKPNQRFPEKKRDRPRKLLSWIGKKSPVNNFFIQRFFVLVSVWLIRKVNNDRKEASKGSYCSEAKITSCRFYSFIQFCFIWLKSGGRRNTKATYEECSVYVNYGNHGWERERKRIKRQLTAGIQSSYDHRSSE